MRYSHNTFIVLSKTDSTTLEARMALTQIQIIQSLGDSMTWLEKELSWNVPITELRHLTGRIGELYGALMTNGQMATEVNQSGYDVVSGNGERVSVKTTGKQNNSGHISFNPNTLNQVDRIMIFRINTEEMQIETLFDGSVEDARLLMNDSGTGGKSTIAMSKLSTSKPIDRDIPRIKEVEWENYKVIELENGSIEVLLEESTVRPSKPHLRKIARELNVSLLNSNGNYYNTRQLGNLIINTLDG